MTNSVKKALSLAVTIPYSIVSLLWCYVLVSNLVYNISLLSLSGENAIGIIVDIAMLFLFPEVATVFFVLVALAAIIFGTIAAVRKQPRRRLHIAVCVLATVALLTFWLIPVNTYVVAYYILVQDLPFLKYLNVAYNVLAVAMVVSHIVLAIKRRVG